MERLFQWNCIGQSLKVNSDNHYDNRNYNYVDSLVNRINEREAFHQGNKRFFEKGEKLEKFNSIYKADQFESFKMNFAKINVTIL